MRVVFFGSPPFALPVFARLLDGAHRPLALVTPPDRPRGRGQKLEPSALVDLARARGVPVLQPASPHTPEFLAELRALAPDVLVVASYGVIMKEELLALAPFGALNVHASLLPRHRGASPIQAAILAGDATTGVCVQRMVKALDEGDVLCSAERPIGSEETAGELLGALAPLGGEVLVDALDLLAAGKAVFTPQDGARATYARKLKKEHGRLDFGRPAAELARLIRALHPWPTARCLDPKGRELSILRARVHGGDPPGAAAERLGQPGELLARPGDGLCIACGEGALDVLEVTPVGKRPMAAAEFQRGARFAPGSRFTSLPPGTPSTAAPAAP
jgi:methionyl-tRNA formyltransferase